ncbi:pyridoxamine 5'-phosphate oxidase [Adhaeribacter soli]|uniref:Pyridoxine/pyridoxamine 5'-phosphate oxidase n=1 Tax=Adhaeribacter soli TaxID=2607655 RepID=A0A5N1IKI5_9BACT|nr:pyridoxamine 5'-phosphate oxidase [Adhaeribacter soli]KAA9325174.1 pyridoxamine 5'-phosphate oxidase [Adhaeribacter soli]
MNQPPSLADIRKNYSLKELSKSSVLPDPVMQFELWLNEALQANVEEATAMVLSTATPQGRPSARVVLLKGIENGCFLFYTNYESRKGNQLLENPFGAITFFWPALERQVRLEGKISKVPEIVSDTYFNSRPVGSQVGAWASPQSRTVENREALEQAEKQFASQFEGKPHIPRPAHWGGFQLEPDYVEFWQGRPNRLHDRIVYDKQETGNWQIKRLAP